MPTTTAEGSRRRRRAKRERLNEIKLTRGCMDCGYDAHPAALQWDHVETPSRASRGEHQALSLNWSWERIAEEIAKCELVCANCHAVRTAERGYGKGWHDHTTPHAPVVHATKRCYDHGCRLPECVEANTLYHQTVNRRR